MSGLIIDHQGPVARLTLDRPARLNAMDQPMLDALDEAAGQGDGLSLQSFASAMLAFGEDGKEGTAAFEAKRAPAWRGE